MARNFIHPVAREYFERIENAGNTVTDKTSVNIFACELSELIDPCLWTAWPLRSIHNAGSGTTVFALGKKSETVGILINSPTWTVNGIQFDNNTMQYIATNHYLETIGASWAVVNRVNSTSSSSFSFWGANANDNNLQMTHSRNSAGHSIDQTTSGPVTNHRVTFTYNPTDNTFNSFIASWNEDTGSLWLNGSYQTGPTAWSNPPHKILKRNPVMNNIILGATNGSSSARGNTAIHAVQLFFDQELSSDLVVSIQNIIKNTIGKELNLP